MEALRPRLSRDSLRIHEDWIFFDKMPDCAFKCKEFQLILISKCANLRKNFKVV